MSQPETVQAPSKAPGMCNTCWLKNVAMKNKKMMPVVVAVVVLAVVGGALLYKYRAKLHFRKEINLGMN